MRGLIAALSQAECQDAMLVLVEEVTSDVISRKPYAAASHRTLVERGIGGALDGREEGAICRNKGCLRGRAV